MRKPAATANGASATAKHSIPPKIAKYGPAGLPRAAALTAALPNIKTGIYSGSTSSEINIPPRLSPTVSEAPIQPNKLRTPVPSSKLLTNTGIEAVERFSITANRGDTRANNKPVTNQWAPI